MKKLRWQLIIAVVALIAIAVLLLGQQPVLQTVLPEPSVGGVYIEGIYPDGLIAYYAIRL